LLLDQVKRYEPIYDIIIRKIRKNDISFKEEIKNAISELKDHSEFMDSNYLEQKDKLIKEKTDELVEFVFSTEFPYHDKIYDIVFPPYERKELIHILKSSPTSLNYIVSMELLDLEKIVVLQTAYFQFYLNIFANVNQQLESMNGKVNDDILIEFVKNELFNKKRKCSTPIFTLLNAFLIGDIFNNRFVISKWVWDYNNRLYTDSTENLRILQQYSNIGEDD
jgi:hypothetical protein